jgi:hypothetical protein
LVLEITKSRTLSSQDARVRELRGHGLLDRVADFGVLVRSGSALFGAGAGVSRCTGSLCPARAGDLPLKSVRHADQVVRRGTLRREIGGVRSRVARSITRRRLNQER